MSLDIVMPVYNEEGCIEDVIKTIQKEILSEIPNSRLLAINDGSRDRTPEIIDRLGKEFPQVIPVHKPNGGHGDALLHGLFEADAEWIFLMDSDDQFELKDFWKLWNKKERYDILTGVRRERHDPLSRKILTRIVRFSILLIFGTYIEDANIPFKLLRREVWEETENLIPRTSLAPSLFLAIAAKKRLFRYYTTAVTHKERSTGVCSIRYFKLFKFCLRGFMQLLDFRIRLFLMK